MTSNNANDSYETLIWANLRLCREDEERLRRFFVEEIGIKRKFVKEKLHITVYHGRRPMPGLEPLDDKIGFTLKVSATRFMLLGPGGENPRPDLDPTQNMVGFRIKGRDSETRQMINAYRLRVSQYETPEVLGSLRRPSTKNRSAFGARCFQPHMTLLKEGSGISPLLSQTQAALCAAIEELSFDTFQIQIKTRTRR